MAGRLFEIEYSGFPEFMKERYKSNFISNSSNGISAYCINNTYIVVNKKEKTKVLLLGSINKIKETKSKLEKESKKTLIELKKK